MDLVKNFGSMVFNDSVMRERLSAEVYENFKSTSNHLKEMDKETAKVVAKAMQEWAIDMGATHYSHWFQPMTNVTAGKHDSFIEPSGDGKIILDFSYKALIKGEPDASSFPSGGLRATFEARGYTTWDPTSPAFVREGTLYIPTAFYAYTGESLDTKTPLLKSMQALDKQTMRVLKAIGNTTSSHVVPCVGPEQEYFLIDRDMYEKRLDLKLCGRTVFGAKPPKGQELEDHYCGRIRIRVASFMKELDEELWKLGIPVKTKHNESAPAQHELAPVYETANIACDHNQMTMEVMRTIAKKHGLACLLHEKPFAGINGSGKHNNFSIATDDGINLLKPGKNPAKNLSFQLFLSAVIRAVDNYSDLLRLSAANVGNEHRLGGFEAPPSIISIFLGEPLTKILCDTASGIDGGDYQGTYLKTGITAVADILKDDSDRNRTSPFAFTGNKFEFRMVGSSQSIAFSNVVLCTTIAQSLSEFADILEKRNDTEIAIKEIIADVVEKNLRVVFNGNNYSTEWVEIAKERGLPIYNSSLEAFSTFTLAKNVKLFEEHQIFTSVECHSRQEILLENYQKVLLIEAAVMLEMINRQILPSLTSYAGKVAKSYNQLSTAGVINTEIKDQIVALSDAVSEISDLKEVLKIACEKANRTKDIKESANIVNKEVKLAMHELRLATDKAETITSAKAWAIPTYTDIIYRV